MDNSKIDNDFLKKILNSSKTIAMVGVSFLKKEEKSTIIKRRPSIIVMEYIQEFGYKVIPVNPYSAGKKINGEIVFANGFLGKILFQLLLRGKWWRSVQEFDRNYVVFQMS